MSLALAESGERALNVAENLTPRRADLVDLFLEAVEMNVSHKCCPPYN